MAKINFKIIQYGTPEYKAAVALREGILRKPMGQTFLPEELEQEKDHIHFAAFRGEEIVGAAVLVPEGKECKMQRVVVKVELQKSGIGSNMMVFFEEYAKAKGFISIYCHARDSAVKFYLKKHYLPEGDYFEEDTIPHLKMRKYLSWRITKSKPKEKSAIIDKIVNFNQQMLNIPPEATSSILLNYIVKIEGIIIGGINSILYFKQSVLHINQLFVEEKYRGQRLGSYLLCKVEEEARANGAKLVHLSTFDWQAKDFYLNHGYEIFGVLDDCPEGHKCYYMKKKL